MDRFHFGVGLSILVLSLAGLITFGLTNPNSPWIWLSGTNVVLGSFFIAYAFPKKPT